MVQSAGMMAVEQKSKSQLKDERLNKHPSGQVSVTGTNWLQLAALRSTVIFIFRGEKGRRRRKKGKK
jgi:hypothetical protein